MRNAVVLYLTDSAGSPLTEQQSRHEGMNLYIISELDIRVTLQPRFCSGALCPTRKKIKETRKGVARYEITLVGRAAHAGEAAGEGASAVHELA